MSLRRLLQAGHIICWCRQCNTDPVLLFHSLRRRLIARVHQKGRKKKGLAHFRKQRRYRELKTSVQDTAVEAANEVGSIFGAPRATFSLDTRGFQTALVWTISTICEERNAMTLLQITNETPSNSENHIQATHWGQPRGTASAKLSCVTWLQHPHLSVLPIKAPRAKPP